MKNTTAWAIANAAMWLAVSAAVIAAVYATGRISMLWFFLIPAYTGYSASSKQESDKDKETDDAEC